MVRNFEEEFSLSSVEAIRRYEDLIDKIGASKSGIWNIDYMKNYFMIVYNIAMANSGKVMYTNGEFIIFNTGLLENTSCDIYCIGEQIKNDEKDLYKLLGFVTKEECRDECYKYKYVLDKMAIDWKCKYKEIFNRLSRPTCIFENEGFVDKTALRLPENDNDIDEEIIKFRDGIISRCTKQDDKSKKIYIDIKKAQKTRCASGWPHLIIDGCDNLPRTLLKHLIDIQPDYRNPYSIRFSLVITKSLDDELKNGNVELPEEIRKREDEIIKERCNLIKYILEKAFKQSREDSSLPLVPFFYPMGGGVNYALPLYIGHGHEPDSVLVFDKKGIAKTILNMYEIKQNFKILGVEATKHYPWLKEL